MTNEQMERHLASAVEKTAPDDVNGVLSRCEARKGTVIPMTTKKTTKRRWTSLIAACLAVMLLGGGLFYQQVNAVASVVSLDVNPSIELKVNRSEKVLARMDAEDDRHRSNPFADEAELEDAGFEYVADDEVNADFAGDDQED